MAVEALSGMVAALSVAASAAKVNKSIGGGEADAAGREAKLAETVLTGNWALLTLVTLAP